MILLQTNKVARHFGAETLFDNIQLEIQEKSRIALVGRNGAGKSTLLKIIAGLEAPDEGTISKSKQLTLGYLAQNTGLQSNRTIFEELLSVFDPVIQLEKKIRQFELELGTVDPSSEAYQKLLRDYDSAQHQFEAANGYGYQSEIKAVLNGFRFDESFYDQAIATLSGGQKTRLALAKLLLEKPQLLILDEPTNHLDIETLAWLENYLSNYSGALLLVSHDRYFLDKLATEVYELSRHKIHHYKGNYSRYLSLKEERLMHDWKEYQKQQAEIDKLEDFVARNLVRASTTKRAQSRRKQLEKMERLDKPQGDEKSANFLFSPAKESGTVVLTGEALAIGYQAPPLSYPVNLDIRKHEAIALVGPNGIGKSTLLKSIIGQIPFLQGNIQLGANVTIGYYDQEQAQLTSNKTVLQELWDEHPTTPEKNIRTILGNFLFTGEDVEKTIPLLSGGEKARLALAKLSMGHENFLLLDEPTNHLDIDSKEVLENALIAYTGTLFFVSHDRYFINRIATKVIELSADGSKLYHGDYDYYVEKKQEEALLREQALQNAEETTNCFPPQQSTAKQAFAQSKDVQRKIRSLQRTIEEQEERLALLEAKSEALQADMVRPEHLNDHQKLIDLQAELTEIEAEQEIVLAAWEEASLALEDYPTTNEN